MDQDGRLVLTGQCYTHVQRVAVGSPARSSFCLPVVLFPGRSFLFGSVIVSLFVFRVLYEEERFVCSRTAPERIAIRSLFFYFVHLSKQHLTCSDYIEPWTNPIIKSW